jgi:hypothetical protein
MVWRLFLVLLLLLHLILHLILHLVLILAWRRRMDVEWSFPWDVPTMMLIQLILINPMMILRLILFLMIRVIRGIEWIPMMFLALMFL